MTPIEQIAVELASMPHLWWGHHTEHRWFVVDQKDARNSGELRRLLRCSDWSALPVSRQEFGSSQFVWFKNYLAALPSDKGP